MKNSLKRLFTKKSTYIMMVVIPVFISMAGLFLTVTGNGKICVAVTGDDRTYDSVVTQLGHRDNIILEKADTEHINTDYIMGKYDYVIDKEDLEIVGTIVAQAEESPLDDSDQTEKMLAMLMVAYITIASFYSSSVIRDRNEGIISRYCYSGHSRSCYMKGTFLSVCIAAGVQIIAIMLIWQMCLDNYYLSVKEFILIGIFVTILSGVIGFVSSMISRSEMMSGILASSIAVIFAIIGGAFVPYDSMPEVIQKISIISPVRWLFLIVK